MNKAVPFKSTALFVVIYLAFCANTHLALPLNVVMQVNERLLSLHQELV